MASAKQAPRVALKERNELLSTRAKAPAAMAAKSAAASTSKVLPVKGKKKGMTAASVKVADEVDMEKMRKALVVVVDELGAKINGTEPVVETGKAKRSVKALLQALVALVEAQKQAAAFQKLVDEAQWINLEDMVSGEVDEEHLKLVARLEDQLLHMWDGDWRSKISRKHVCA